MSKVIKTIIFDLGGVLIRWDPKRLYRKIFSDEIQMNHFLETVCTMDWNEQQDAGRPFAEANKILIDQFPEFEKEILAYFGRWTEMLGGAIEGTVDILGKLKASKKYKIYALTNWSAETFPFALERFDFLQLFEGILVSGEVKLKKPDPRIYQMILDQYAIEAQHSLFIDDSLRNIHAAQKMGIQCIHFTSVQNLTKELQILKLIDN